jgi:hypothetical protein
VSNTISPERRRGRILPRQILLSVITPIVLAAAAVAELRDEPVFL